MTFMPPLVVSEPAHVSDVVVTVFVVAVVGVVDQRSHQNRHVSQMLCQGQIQTSVTVSPTASRADFTVATFAPAPARFRTPAVT